MNWVNEGPVDAAVSVTNEFQITLEDGQATVELLVDYATVDDARGVVEPYLRAWEIEAFLGHVAQYDDFQQPLVFEFDGAGLGFRVRNS